MDNAMTNQQEKVKVMKSICVLTDGQELSIRREMSPEEFCQANREAKESTGGAWWWILDEQQSGIRAFEVVCHNLYGHFGPAVYSAPDKRWLEVVFGEHWRFVSVSAYEEDHATA